MGVVCVSLLIYIRTNTHAHTRTRGPAVGRAVGLEVETTRRQQRPGLSADTNTIFGTAREGVAVGRNKNERYVYRF